PGRRRFLYFQAVQMIAFLQAEGTRSLTMDLPASNTALDAERLLFELRFFAEHYVEGLQGSPLSDAEAGSLDEWFVRLAKEVAGYRRVLCHRDFHSRNLMVRGERLFMVDFQDARMGPFTYDLASLVRDSYVQVPEELEREAIEFYREVTCAPESPQELRRAFRRTALQRNIKALGTFASQAMLRKNRLYLPYIAPTLASVTSSLDDEEDREIETILRGPLAYQGH
ncbi:MAG TPA: phosphotransferase, partial [Candidatus Polarisedimenticolia bacterium]|nr:phosphotransferase [Candidatus Polarisedimenticolia bacterium]